MDKLAEILKSAHNGHLGKQILCNLKRNEDNVHQINVVDGTSETCGSVRRRIIKTAHALRGKGLKIGDVVMICAMNHNDASIPFLASQCLGSIVINLVVGMTKEELKHIFTTAQSKIIFVDPPMADIIKETFDELSINSEIIVFGKLSNYTSFEQFYNIDCDDNNFECTDFDPETTVAFAPCSSGTTGMPKLVSITHKVGTLWTILPSLGMQSWQGVKTIRYLTFSPMYWSTGIMAVLSSVITGNIRLQSSIAFNPELAFRAIETYKPNFVFLSPVAIYEMTKYPNRKDYDCSSLLSVFTGGSVLCKETVKEFEESLSNGKVLVGYVCTEAGFISTSADYSKGSIGKPVPFIQWKLVDPETEEIINEPNTTGEIRVKTPLMFKEYYNDPKSTENAFDNDGYYKTGDMLNYDEENNFYFVDRCKEIIKYRNFQISPSELENKIMSLGGVMFVCVVGKPDRVNGELPTAFVQLTPDSKLSAEDINNIIKDSLSDYKQLRGGIVFLNDLPKTYSGKINRKIVNQLKHTIDQSATKLS